MTTNKLQLNKIFSSPKIVGVVADANTGKSNLLYNLITDLHKDYDFKLYSYGLKVDLGEQKLYSMEELEQVKDGIIFCDEFFTLFDLEDRKKRREIENTLRLIYHNNNVFVLCGLPDNFKKFISSKLDAIFFKKSTLSTFINGSTIKNLAISYKGRELGSTILNIAVDKAILYDGAHYYNIDVPYLQVYDTKINNQALCIPKKCVESVPILVQENVPADVVEEVLSEAFAEYKR